MDGLQNSKLQAFSVCCASKLLNQVSSWGQSFRVQGERSFETAWQGRACRQKDNELGQPTH